MVCSIPLTECTLKMGIFKILAKDVTLPVVFKARYSELGLHQLAPKHQTALCHQTSVESWHTGGAGPPASRVTDGESECLPKCVSWRPCVFTKQNLPPLALQSKYNLKAICPFCALAASVFPALVMSKGHHLEEVLELPLVMEDKVEYKKD